MPNASHLLVVSAQVDAAVEKDWNDWYDKVHLPDVAGCPAFSPVLASWPPTTTAAGTT